MRGESREIAGIHSEEADRGEEGVLQDTIANSKKKFLWQHNI